MLRLSAAFLVLALADAAEAQTYTYVQQSLRVPWALYFVFLALVLVPFAILILLAWRQHFRAAEKPEAAPPGAARRMNRFLRFVLPAILVVVFAVVALFVLNAFEATELMRTEKRAGPTLLNR